MKRFNFLTMPLVDLFACVEHTYKVLSRASEVRLLSDEELDFFTLRDRFDCGFISEREFRLGCISYYES